ncbi:MAG: DUF2225 domain-containing protein [Treponema sp.]|jgi:uncharacterized protein (DUF2225 family)|nr:DUF2225 domain-containing protein [Treponema sp.]
MQEERELKISFFSKEEYRCPACGAAFKREELLSGSGRLIAGDLTDELHRLYEPSAKFGEIHPLIYAPTVCPECWFASLDKEDFSALPEASRGKARAEEDERRVDVLHAFAGTDFSKNRTLISGAAGHYLALRCYDHYPKEFSPTIKQGIAALRTGWLLDELNRVYPGQHFDWLAVLFKKKACFLYGEALAREQAGAETLSGLKTFGPDTDKNYGYEGFLYLVGLLRLRYGSRENQHEWESRLEEAKRSIAKMFGLGKTSKKKPGPLLEHARNLYDDIGKALNEADE